MALVFRTNLIHRNVWVMLLFRKSIIFLKRNSGCLNKRMTCGLQDWTCDLIHRSLIDKFCWWGRSLKCSLLSFNFLSLRWICALCSLPPFLFCPFKSKLISSLLAVFPVPKTDWVKNYPGMGWNLGGRSQGAAHHSVSLSLQPSCRNSNSSGVLLQEEKKPHPMAEVMLPNVPNLQGFSV